MYDANEHPKKCPKCGGHATKVNQSFLVDGGETRRRHRKCRSCGHLFSTDTPVDTFATEPDPRFI